MDTPASPRSGREAFTLIELLIVVAIIAILAAIAVPNFLEAQVRAKVSRVKSDMRAIATAQEAYRVDFNEYTRAHANPGQVPGAIIDTTFRTINPRVLRFRGLTTPVAYMTSIPEDTFNLQTSANYDDRQHGAFIYSDRKSYEELVPNALTGGGGAIYAILYRFEYPNATWVMRSRGPIGGVGEGANVSQAGSQVRSTSAYDPTNGTVSSGNIFHLGGIGFLGR